ncbi:large-conductance mechanosensitive channel protein MscL [Fusobacterium sp.]|uniref:large-conductance mechanosensitive channel protein MscL n=1 Tax=Fusobacterium sp. TaxID=68766 RepID=UPI00396C83A7
MGFFKEFKKFALRGNVLDMAVGVIIGGAFGKIVTSLVNDVLLPVIGIATGKIDISKLAITIKEGAEGVDPVVVKYGMFLQNIVDFVIICLCIFMMIKLMNSVVKKEEEAKPAPGPSNEEVLLTEIRDLLKNK